MATEISTSVEEILKRPYSWNLSPQPDGTWVAEIREIPGCYAHGDSQEQAIELLRVHARELLTVLIKRGKPIPQPIETEFSGNFALRMPKDLHKRAAHAAHRNGTSLNQFIVSAVSVAVGVSDFSVFLSDSLFVAPITLKHVGTIALGGITSQASELSMSAGFTMRFVPEPEVK